MNSLFVVDWRTSRLLFQAGALFLFKSWTDCDSLPSTEQDGKTLARPLTSFLCLHLSTAFFKAVDWLSLSLRKFNEKWCSFTPLLLNTVTQGEVKLLLQLVEQMNWFSHHTKPMLFCFVFSTSSDCSAKIPVGIQPLQTCQRASC